MKLLNKFLLTLICATSIGTCSALTPQQQERLIDELRHASRLGFLLPALQQALAAANGRSPVMQYLLEIPGADISALDDYTLIWAAADGPLNVVQFLVANGANIHALDDEAVQVAALAAECELDRWAVVEYLVRHGASFSALQEYQLRNFFNEYILPELQTAVATNNWHRVEELISTVSVQGISADLQDLVRDLLVPAVQKKLDPVRLVLFTRTQITNPQLASRTLSFIVGRHTIAAFSHLVKEDTHEITQ